MNNIRSNMWAAKPMPSAILWHHWRSEIYCSFCKESLIYNDFAEITCGLLVIWGQFHQCSMSSFCKCRSQKRKKDGQINCQSFFALLGSACAKAAHRTLMKWTLGLLKGQSFLFYIIFWCASIIAWSRIGCRDRFWHGFDTISI